MGKGHAYVNALIVGRYKPSAKACDAIAAYFGDNPRTVRILAGIELPPTDEDKTVFEIKEIAASLSLKGKRELLRYAHYLKDQGD